MTVEIHGFCEERFAPVREAFAANFADGLEVGAAVAATLRGEPVVDLWAGHADFARTRPWSRDTTVNIFSTTKAALILAFLMLVDRGQVDLDATVATYWPEFAQGGKGHVTVRQAMTHSAGVPGFDPPVEYTSLYDWDASCARLAAQPHWFGGEPRICYHAATYGFLLGEIMRRVDGRRPRQFFREEIGERAGLDFSFCRQTEAELARGAEVNSLHPVGGYIDRNELAVKVTSSTGGFGTPEQWASAEGKRAEIPAGDGATSARSLARLGAMAANGGELDGVRYLSKGILAEAVREQAHGEDPYLGEVRLGLEQHRAGLRVRLWVQDPQQVASIRQELEAELASLGRPVDLKVFALPPGTPDLRAMAGANPLQALG